MREKTPWKTFAPFAFVFFGLWGAQGMWNVPFSNILRAAGLQDYLAPAFACNAIAAFISPLLVGSMADRGFAPVKLLRTLLWFSGSLLAFAFLAIERGWGGGAMLVGIQLHALCASPTNSLITTIALAELKNPSREFGPLRTWATLGWIAAGLAVSWLMAADSSPLSGFVAAGVIFLLGFATYWLPSQKPGQAGGARNWREILGLDALLLLKHKDHRTILLSVTLFGIPMAAFYPYAPLHLTALGFDRPSATMSLGQISEIASLLMLAGLTQRIRLKWILLSGLGLGVLRYGLFAIDTSTALISGIMLHGACYTFYNVTAQIYLAERVEQNMKARAQALFAMLTAGVSNLFGYLGTGALFQATRKASAHSWTTYWLVLSIAALAVTLYFHFNYHGQGSGFFRRQTERQA